MTLGEGEIFLGITDLSDLCLTIDALIIPNTHCTASVMIIKILPALPPYCANNKTAITQMSLKL